MGRPSEKCEKRMVILDASILLDSIEARVDLVEGISDLLLVPYKVCVLKSTLDELRKLARRGPWRRSRIARLALSLVESRGVEVIDDSQIEGASVDEKIARVARETRAIVATDDRELKKKLAGEGIPVIFLREGKKLAIWGEIYA